MLSDAPAMAQGASDCPAIAVGPASSKYTGHVSAQAIFSSGWSINVVFEHTGSSCMLCVQGWPFSVKQDLQVLDAERGIACSRWGAAACVEWDLQAFRQC